MAMPVRVVKAARDATKRLVLRVRPTERISRKSIRPKTGPSNIDKNHFKFLKELVRLEEDEENESIRKEFLELSPKERELRGKALLNMRVRERHFSPAEHELATFTRVDQRPLPLFSLEIGDIVNVISSDDPKHDYAYGTVYEKDAESLTVAFNQSPPEWLVEDSLCELHRSVNRVTYKRMLEALDAVFETQNTRLAHFRDISLSEKKAESVPLEAGSIRWLDTGLNDSQKKAVLKALAARDVALVHGPPGTGKTTALIEIIRQSLLKKQSIFVTAPSNTACDNLLERLVEKNIVALRLGHPARISAILREHTMDFRVALHPLARSISEARAELGRLFKKEERYKDRRSPGREAERDVRREISFLKQEVRNLRKEIFELVMKETDVFVGTPASIQDKSIRDKFFDLVVIDEATQATEPITWIPITVAKKVVMAGDHFQLPPTVRSKKAEEKGLGVTLFERYHAILEDGSKALLDRQYRMNEKIMGFSSKQFYENRLIADESVRSQTLAGLRGVTRSEDTESPLLFIDTAGKDFEEKLEEGSESRYNPEEAELVLTELKKLLDLGVPPAEIAVISPYSAQVRLLASRSPHPRIEIDSVDGFQGREKELVIVSLVRSNIEGEMGFLADTRRMNVAMTRARRKLVVVGNSATLSSIPFYKSFISYAEAAGGYKSAWQL